MKHRLVFWALSIVLFACTKTHTVLSTQICTRLTRLPINQSTTSPPRSLCRFQGQIFFPLRLNGLVRVKIQDQRFSCSLLVPLSCKAGWYTKTPNWLQKCTTHPSSRGSYWATAQAGCHMISTRRSFLHHQILSPLWGSHSSPQVCQFLLCSTPPDKCVDTRSLYVLFLEKIKKRDFQLCDRRWKCFYNDRLSS